MELFKNKVYVIAIKYNLLTVIREGLCKILIHLKNLTTLYNWLVEVILYVLRYTALIPRTTPLIFTYIHSLSSKKTTTKERYQTNKLSPEQRRASGLRMESKLNSIIRNDWCFGKSCSRYPRSKKVKENHLKLPDIRWTVDGQLINIEVKSRNRPPWIYPMIQQTKCNYRLVNPITGEIFCYVLEQSVMHQLAVHGIIPSDIIDLPDHKTTYLHEWFEQSAITTDVVAIIKKQQSYVFLLTQGAYDFFISRTYKRRKNI